MLYMYMYMYMYMYIYMLYMYMYIAARSGVTTVRAGTAQIRCLL